jgi:hypothetical protein
MFENDGQKRYKYFFNNIFIDRSYKETLKRELLYKYDKYFTRHGKAIKSIVIKVYYIEK